MRTTFFMIVILALVLGAGCDNEERVYQLHVRFAEPQQLKVGDPVIMTGFPIGRIVSMNSDPLGAGYVVTMQFERSETVKVDVTAVSPCQNSLILIAGSPDAAPAAHDTYLKTAQPIVIKSKPRFEKYSGSVELVLRDTNRSYDILWSAPPDIQFVPVSLDTNRIYIFTVGQQPLGRFVHPQLFKVQLDGQTVYDVQVCEIHNTKMDFKEVPIRYGLPMPDPDGPSREIHRQLFPHHSERVNGGCCVSDSSPRTEKIYVCAECKGAYEKWKEENKKSK